VDTFHELLATSNVITFHVPQTDQTDNMMNPEAFSHLKKGSIFINASRGTVVDIEALTEKLKNGDILGAAIDVYPKVPKSNQEEFVSPLRDFDNVILTPHIGGSTKEAQVNIGIEVAEKLLKYSNNGSTLSSVNFPEVGLPALVGKHRICHIHHNEPGILAKINDIFSTIGVNISAQYLQTNADVGYVVTDVDQGSSKDAFAKLKQIEGTIKSRILY